MMVQQVLSRFIAFISVRSENPELLRAQFSALSRLMPLLYFVLLANAWVLALAFIHQAPLALTVYGPLLLTGICLFRLVLWWRKRNVAATRERVMSELRRANVLAGVLGAMFSAWALSLFPYGDAYEQSYVAFVLIVGALGTMFCLVHLCSAALAVAAVGGGFFVCFFVATENPIFVAMTINVMLVIGVSVVVILFQHRDFVRMVNASTEALSREKAQSRLLRMIDDMPVAVMTVEPDTLNINYVNETSKRLIRRIEHLLPLTADDLLGTCIDVFHKHPQHQRRILADPANLPHNARIKLGPEVLDLKVSAVTDNDGAYIGPMLTWALVTKEVESEQRILQMAHYDTLTGLPNRATFYEELDRRLATPGNRVGLLFVDLDGFKLVNDTRGHRIGDTLLNQVASRLRSICNAPATLVGRLGGDEFAVLVPHHNAEEAEALARRIITAVGVPYDLDYDRSIQIGASIGIALAPQHGETGEALLSRADMALYAAKAAGKGVSRMFQPEMEARIQERVRLEAKLRDALQKREGLFVFYQPIVAIDTGAVIAREALVRWYHPQRGWVSPGEFVPVAEQSGLIDELGDFVLNAACREAVGWADGARVAVNVSASQFGEGTLVSAVQRALAETGLPPDRLEVEVTETALLGDEQDVMAELRSLRAFGVRVALDDFGTGYSSLAHLRAFPFDKIKIDGTFVRDAVERPDCAAVVQAVATLGRRLGVSTVAEGVETQAHLDRVREEGCSEVQGYLFSRPLPNEHDAPIVEELNRVEALKRQAAQGAQPPAVPAQTP
ncbi:EAL domain-containing protein [Acetobacter sp. TBRC 12305]|uniref:EAL domain-containing protein n=1 Tax=Acetobacter garciniae TaxID=2817435 RepID=A0A939KRI3_9PROT|nr:EAL domain-containing protein [Acetobacter garciniae]MBO1325166.1 EAL domain-containing protein [Acetobacter garciniae]MBX0344863.1 EAL domain-containing protein [Acetobacter garciniae]